jgi:hypothetical protein
MGRGLSENQKQKQMSQVYAIFLKAATTDGEG